MILPATPDSIEKAAAILRAGGLVGMPTETVYGLAGNANDDRAVAAIFAAKQRPSFNPLIVHLPTVAAAKSLALFSDYAAKLAEQFWPGPLTMVLPQQPNSPVSKLATAGLPTIALRVPNHQTAQDLMRACGLPLAAPSANRSGEISPTQAKHVEKSLGSAIDMILDGGECLVGLESTIVDLSTGRPTVLRMGGISLEQIEAVIGPIDRFDGKKTGPIKAPGMLLRHYSPSIPLRMGIDNPKADEALLAFGADIPAGFQNILNLSASGDLLEAAANLYKFLHQLDHPSYSGIAAMPVPDHGLGRAINDRLRRAAAKDHL